MIKGTHLSSSQEIKALVTKELKSLKEKGVCQVLPWMAESNVEVH